MRERKELVDAINNGGSVLVGGKIITSLDDLPSQADLAKGDPAKEAAAKAALEDQVKALQAELAKLQKPEPEKEPHTTQETANPVDLEKLSVEQLRALPEAEGLPAELKKTELIAAIRAK